MARSRQSQDKGKVRSREGQGKFKVTSRQGKTKIIVRSRQGQGRVKVTQAHFYSVWFPTRLNETKWYLVSFCSGPTLPYIYNT